MSNTTTISKPKFDQIPNGRAAMWWLIVSEIVIFGGLVACYLLFRLRHPEWAEMSQYTSTFMGALNTFVLLTSSFFAVLAHDFAVKNELKKARNFIYLTIACGFIFLIVKSFEYTNEISHGFTISSHLFWSFYFFMTGLHGLHVIAGMVFLFVVSRSISKGEQIQRVEFAGLYWHFVDLVWIFLFPLLYIAK